MQSQTMARQQHSYMTATSMTLKTIVLSVCALLAAGILSATAAGASRAAQASPGIQLQGASAYSFLVGDLRITALSDGTVPQDLHTLLRDTTDERTDGLLAKGFVSNPVEASINVFMFRLGGRLFLVYAVNDTPST